MPRLILLWTDVVLWVLVLALFVACWLGRRNPRVRQNWARVFSDTPALCASVVLAAFLLLTLLDSVHFRRALPASTAGVSTAYDTRTESLLDVLLSRQIASREASYSMPLAAYGFTKESVLVEGREQRAFTRLQFGGVHLKNPGRDRAADVWMRVARGAAGGACVFILVALFTAWLGRHGTGGFAASLRRIARNDTGLPIRAGLLSFGAVALVAGPAIALMGHYHVLGTDRTGNDVLYQALKSVRTAFVIGTLATIATLPPAIGLGVLAGYCKGWVDEVVQYLYTTLSSIPNVLLIAACVLMLQVAIDQHPEWFETGAERADLRIFLLCAVLGLTGWAGLCRLVRAETMKLRELEYVQAATAFGVGPLRIMARHIFPNVLHLVLITTVLDFSALILYEAVLSYVGVGVEPSMNSFGGMINLARSEMSRDPVVWWSFASAFGFMVTLVLAANLFADGVREAFDPRGRHFKVRRKRVPALVAAPAAGMADAVPAAREAVR